MGHLWGQTHDDLAIRWPGAVSRRRLPSRGQLSFLIWNRAMARQGGLPRRFILASLVIPDNRRTTLTRPAPYR